MTAARVKHNGIQIVLVISSSVSYIEDVQQSTWDRTYFLMLVRSAESQV